MCAPHRSGTPPHLSAVRVRVPQGLVIWSLLRALAPCIRDGVVEVWAVDPKGRMEAPARLFTQVPYADSASMVALL